MNSLPLPGSDSSLSGEFLQLPGHSRCTWQSILMVIAGGVTAAVAATTRSLPILGLAFLPLLIAIGLSLLNRSHIVLWALVLLAPVNDHAGISLGGTTIRAYGLLTLAGLGLLALYLVHDKTNPYLRRAFHLVPLFLPLILFSISKVATVVLIEEFPMTMTRSFSLKYVIFSSLLFGTGFVTATYLRDWTHIKRVLYAWIILGNIITLYGFIQIVLSNTLHLHLVHHRDVIFYGRPYSVFREPDVLGSFVGAILLTILPHAVYRTGVFSDRLVRMTLLLQGTMLIALFVRAAWVATALCLGVWFASALVISRLGPLLKALNATLCSGILGLITVSILIPSFAGKLIGRFASLAAPSTESASEFRMRDIQTMMAKLKPESLSNPELMTLLFGHGDFSWSYWAPTLLGENYDRAAIELMQETGIVLTHPGFFMTLAVFFDNGLVGVSLLTLFFAGLFVSYLRTLAGTRSLENQVMAISTLLPVVCILICFQFSYDPISPFWWVMIGIHAATMLLIRQRLAATEPDWTRQS